MDKPIVISTPWMTWLKSHIGELELTGKAPTEFDKMVFSHTNYGELKGSLPPSCAATACAALELTGYTSPHSALALSFKDYGTPMDEPIYGTILVFDFDGEHHVSFYEKDTRSKIYVTCLGGNQRHRVCRGDYPAIDIIAMRWPIKNFTSQPA